MKTTYRVLFFLVFLACAALFAAGPNLSAATPEEDAAESLAAAARLEALGFDEDALLHLELELAHNPASTDLLKAVAHRYLKGANFKPSRSLELYGDARTRNPEDQEILVGVAESAAAIAATIDPGVSEQAKRTFALAVSAAKAEAENLIEVSGDTNARAHSLLGELNRREAVELRPEFPEDPIQAQAAMAAYEKKRRELFEAARAHYERSLALNISDVIAERALVYTLIELEDFAAAKKLLDSVELRAGAEEDGYLGEIVEELRAKLALAQTPIDLKELARAWDYLAKASPSKHNALSAAIAARAASYERVEDGVRIIRAWRDYWHAQSRLSETIALLEPFVPGADAEANKSKLIVPEFCFLSGLAWIDMYDRQNDDNDPEGTQRALFLERAKRHADAAMVCGDVIHSVYELQGHLALERGDFENAKKNFKSMALLEPNDAEYANLAYFCEDMAKGLLTLGDYRIYMRLRTDELTNARRLNLLEGLLKQAPNFPDLLAFIGRLRYQGGQFPEAIEALKAALKAHPENDEWLAIYAVANIRVKDWEIAYQSFIKLDELKPSDFSRTWRELLARVVEKKTLDGEALAEYQNAKNETFSADVKAKTLAKALNFSPTFAEAAIDLAALYMQNNQLVDALTFASDGLKYATTDSTKASALTSLGAVYFGQGEYAKARESYGKAVELMAKDDRMKAQLIDFQAKAALLENNWSLAESLQEEAIRISFDQSDSYLRRFHAEDAAKSQLPAARFLTKGIRTRLSADLRTGENFSLVGKYGQSIKGGGENIEKFNDVELEIEILESPAVASLWKVGVTFRKAYVPTELLDRRVILTISPLSGMQSEEWQGKLGSDVELTEAEINQSEPFLQAVVELFTLGLGKVEITHPFLWRNDQTAGALHLKDGSEACYLKSMTSDSLFLHRVAIADYRSKADPEKVWAPRVKLDVDAILSYPSLRPQELRIQMVHNEVIRKNIELEREVDGKAKKVTEEHAVDVKVSKLEMVLKVVFP